MWQSAGSGPSPAAATPRAAPRNGDFPVSRASNAGSRSSSSASASRSAAVRRPRRAGGDRAHLAGPDAEPAGVERRRRATPRPARRRTSSARRTVPSGAEQVERQLQPVGRRAGVQDQVPVAALRRPAQRTRRRALRPPSARRGSTSTRVTSTPGIRASSRADAAADHAAADDRDPVTEERRGVPQRVHRGLHGPGQHGPCGRHPVRDNGHGRRRDDVRGLVGVEAEDGAADQLGRALLDDARR